MAGQRSQFSFFPQYLDGAEFFDRKFFDPSKPLVVVKVHVHPYILSCNAIQYLVEQLMTLIEKISRAVRDRRIINCHLKLDTINRYLGTK